MAQPLFDVIASALLLLAAASDLRARRIPNSLSLSLLAVGLGAQLTTRGATAAALAFVAAFLLLLGLLPVWRRGWLGGGDVKLLVATTAWVGADRLLSLTLAITLAGGILALAMLAHGWLRARLWPRLAATAWFSRRVPPAALTDFSERSGSLPYGVAIAAGAIWLWLAGDLA